MPRLSVAIPCFESAPFLGDALRSLRAQSRLPDDVVIADDGSTGAATLQLLDALARPDSALRLGLPIRVLREPHRGPGPTRNAAVRATTGELVLPLDADDELERRALEKLEAALAAEPSAAFAFSHVAYFGAVRGTAVPPRYNAWLQLEDNKLVVTALLRRSIFEEHGVWYADLDGYEDWSFWLGVAGRGLHGVCVEEPLFRYRRKGAEGQLARDHVRREALKAELRRRHPALYTEAARAEIKRTWAPALEILFSGQEGSALARFLRRQSFDDVSVTTRSFADAADVLRAARGRFVLWAGDEHLQALARARPSLLEQMVRCAEFRRDRDVIVVPTDEETLSAHAAAERVVPCPPQRLGAHRGDLVALRLDRASSLAHAHLPDGTPPHGLVDLFVKRGRALLFAEDFFGLVREPQRSAPEAVATAQGRPAWRRAADRAAPAARSMRRLAVQLAGEDRVGKLLHPWKERLEEASWRFDALEASLRARRVPEGVDPILPASQRMERRLLDLEPALPRRAPLALRGGPRKRVLLVLPDLSAADLQRTAIDVAAWMPADRYELLAVTTREARHELASALAPHVADLVLLGETAAGRDHPELMLQLAHDRGVDALLVAGSPAGLDCARLAKQRGPGLRVADWWRGGPAGDRHDAFVDLRVVATEELRERLRASGADVGKVRVIRDACDTERLDPDRIVPGRLRGALGLAEDASIVAFVGPLDGAGDPVLAAQVCAALDRSAGPLHAVFAGDGPLRAAVEADLVRSGLRERSHFVRDDDRVDLLRDAALLLVTSQTETVPVAVLEAMALRVPVVALDVGGMAEVVADRTGVCVPNASGAAARARLLADAAAAILRNRSLRAALGAAARDRVRALCDARKIRAAWQAVFADLTSG